MNKITNLTLSGVAMLVAGVVLLISETIGVATAKILVPLLFMVGGVLAILFARANPKYKLANQYHMIQGVGMIVFGLLIAMLPKSLGEFLQYVTYFIMIFGFAEIMFGFLALSSGTKLNMGILMSRFIVGFINIIGAVLLLVTSISDEVSGLLIAGVLMILGGIGFILFSFRIKKLPALS